MNDISHDKYFVSIVWGYPRQIYSFSPEENYHLHALKVAKTLGYKPMVLIRQGVGDIQSDPNFDSDIQVIDYKNILNFLWQLLNFRKAVFYVNSYEWQSFLVPFVCRHTIFMGHTHVVRQTKLKQFIQDVVFRLFSRIRLNNEEERQYLINRGISADKLFVVPLSVSSKYFYYTENPNRKDLVYFGNVTAKKNLATILEAIKLVSKEKPDIKLHVVGKIHDQNFWKLADKLKLKNNIVAYGFLPLEDLARILNSFPVYVNSSFDEGQCVAVYNAALCGCALCLPAIMSFTGVFKDKALFHEVTDYEKLAKDVLYYLDNPQKAKQDNQECIKMIKRNYSKEVVEEEMKKLFKI